MGKIHQLKIQSKIQKMTLHQKLPFNHFQLIINPRVRKIEIIK